MLDNIKIMFFSRSKSMKMSGRGFPGSGAGEKYQISGFSGVSEVSEVSDIRSVRGVKMICAF